MKLKKSIKIGIVAGACAALSVAFPVVANPGSESDPLVSQSYIEQVLVPQLEEYVQKEIEKIENSSTSSSAETFEIVELDKGDKLICENGTELILRMGTAKISATEKGGIADATYGADLPDGMEMPSNHLLIVPVNDGRGIKATSDVFVMVKGGYKIK